MKIGRFLERSELVNYFWVKGNTIEKITNIYPYACDITNALLKKSTILVHLATKSTFTIQTIKATYFYTKNAS